MAHRDQQLLLSVGFPRTVQGDFGESRCREAWRIPPYCGGSPIHGEERRIALPQDRQLSTQGEAQMLITKRLLKAEDFASIAAAGPDAKSIRSAANQIVWTFHVDFDQQVTPIKIIMPESTPHEVVLKELTTRIFQKIPQWTEAAMGGAKIQELTE
jgi:hypothetical protein